MDSLEPIMHYQIAFHWAEQETFGISVTEHVWTHRVDEMRPTERRWRYARKQPDVHFPDSIRFAKLLVDQVALVVEIEERVYEHKRRLG